MKNCFLCIRSDTMVNMKINNINFKCDFITLAHEFILTLVYLRLHVFILSHTQYKQTQDLCVSGSYEAQLLLNYSYDHGVRPHFWVTHATSATAAKHVMSRHRYQNTSKAKVPGVNVYPNLYSILKQVTWLMGCLTSRLMDNWLAN